MKCFPLQKAVELNNNITIRKFILILPLCLKIPSLRLHSQDICFIKRIISFFLFRLSFLVKIKKNWVWITFWDQSGCFIFLPLLRGGGLRFKTIFEFSRTLCLAFWDLKHILGPVQSYQLWFLERSLNWEN